MKFDWSQLLSPVVSPIVLSLLISEGLLDILYYVAATALRAAYCIIEYNNRYEGRDYGNLGIQTSYKEVVDIYCDLKQRQIHDF